MYCTPKGFSKTARDSYAHEKYHPREDKEQKLQKNLQIYEEWRAWRNQ